MMDMQNVWLPPTSSAIVHLKAGKHQLTSELTRDDKPVLYYHLVKDETTFSSPVAAKVDYTVFVGSADEVIATYRELTGPCAPMPSWASWPKTSRPTRARNTCGSQTRDT